jgi:2-methylcitrate synthase
LTYRGYDIYDLADNACFEEVAYLLLHGKLPNQAELDAYIEKIKANRGLPDALKAVLEVVPGDAHPMDVLRTGVSFLGNIEPEGDFSNQSSVADRLLACIPSMLLYWHRFHADGVRIDTETGDRKPETTASPGISCTCCTTRNRRNCTASASIRH